MACGTAGPTNGPEKEGPDHDFGQSPILVTLAGGKRVIVAGQKSGVVHGFDPDQGGKKLWSTTVGRGGALGGVGWGSASDGTNMYVPLSDITQSSLNAQNISCPDSACSAGSALYVVT